MEAVKAIQSNYNKKYVRYIQEDSHLQGYLQASALDPDNPYARVSFELSSTGTVNIKSSYPQRFWEPNDLNNPTWVVAKAEKKNEIPANRYCTLFEIQPVDKTTVRIRYPTLHQYLCLDKVNESYDDCIALLPHDKIPPGRDLFTLVYE